MIASTLEILMENVTNGDVVLPAPKTPAGVLFGLGLATGALIASAMILTNHRQAQTTRI